MVSACQAIIILVVGERSAEQLVRVDGLLLGDDVLDHKRFDDLGTRSLRRCDQRRHAVDIFRHLRAVFQQFRDDTIMSTLCCEMQRGRTAQSLLVRIRSLLEQVGYHVVVSLVSGDHQTRIVVLVRYVYVGPVVYQVSHDV